MGKQAHANTIMSLLTRLVSPLEGEEKIPVHAFMASLAEYGRGGVTKTQIVNAFSLSGTEQVSLQIFMDNLGSNSIDRSMIHDVLLLGEGGYYTTTQVKNRLGV